MCAINAGASEWDDLLPDAPARGLLFCAAGVFSANRYVAYAAWEGEEKDVVNLAVRQVSWDGVENYRRFATDGLRDFERVMRVLVENGAWELGDAVPVYDLGGPPLDLPTYHVTIAEGQRRNSFAVFDPLALSDSSYLTVVQTLQEYFSDLGL